VESLLLGGCVRSCHAELLLDNPRAVYRVRPFSFCDQASRAGKFVLRVYSARPVSVRRLAGEEADKATENATVVRLLLAALRRAAAGGTPTCTVKHTPLREASAPPPSEPPTPSGDGEQKGAQMDADEALARALAAEFAAKDRPPDEEVGSNSRVTLSSVAALGGGVLVYLATNEQPTRAALLDVTIQSSHMRALSPFLRASPPPPPPPASNGRPRWQPDKNEDVVRTVRVVVPPRTQRVIAVFIAQRGHGACHALRRARCWLRDRVGSVSSNPLFAASPYG
jgi:hypothetical protein